MPGYENRNFEPPAPIAYVTLRNQQIEKIIYNVPMLIDTGADITMIPQSAIDQLALKVDNEKQYELIGFDGNISFSSPIYLELDFLKRTYRGQFLVIDQHRCILGRNILNTIPLLFDGPKLIWREFTCE